MKGLTISGGGGQIGYLAGVYTGLHNAGKQYDVIHGISSGALVGIMAATDQTKRLETLMRTITDDMVAKKRNLALVAGRHLGHWLGVVKPPLGVWDNTPLRNLLRKEILGKTTICDFYCGAYNLETNSYIKFHIPKGTTFTEETVDSNVAMILASTAIPVIFDPVVWGEQRWWDGGLKHHTAIDPMERLQEIEHLTIISTKQPDFATHDIDDIVDVLKATMQTMLDIAAERGFERFELINHMTSEMGEIPRRSGNGVYRHIPSTVYRPERELAPSTKFHYQYTIPDFAYGIRQVHFNLNPVNHV